MARARIEQLQLRPSPNALRWRLRSQRIHFMLALSRAFMRRRAELFNSLMSSLPRPLRVLDVGGVEQFWKHSPLYDDPGLEITLLNIEDQTVDSPRIVSRTGDARDMSMFRDGEFDVVFSNSVIEHVGTFADQRRMALEVQRVSKPLLR